MPVVASRAAVPTQAGTLKVSDGLPPAYVAIARDLGRLVKPRSEWETIRPCHRIAPAEEEVLRQRMLKAGMARPLRLHEVPLDNDNQPLVGGFFAVAKNEVEDRLIFDRRPANGCERRLRWLNLPSASLLRQVILRPHEGLRGSGDDLDASTIA